MSNASEDTTPLGETELHAFAAALDAREAALEGEVRDVNAVYPNVADLQYDMDQATRASENRYVDTIAVTEALFGDSTTANTFQLGIAYQLGTLPISAESIETAIELNGAAVEANKLAFRWGRLWAIDPQKIRDASVYRHLLIPCRKTRRPAFATGPTLP